LAARKPKLLAALEHEVLGGMPAAAPLNLLSGPTKHGSNLEFDSEPGVRLSARCLLVEAKPAHAAVLLSFDESEASTNLVSELRAAGWSVVIPELRATGRAAWPRERVGRAPDHTSAEWALWIGRPMLGQWVHDVRRTLDAFAASHGGLPRDVAVIGKGPAGVIALCAAALDSRASPPWTRWRVT
jgi:alpha-beta hydrolase superfamily lysophospholipase